MKDKKSYKQTKDSTIELCESCNGVGYYFCGEVYGRAYNRLDNLPDVPLEKTDCPVCKGMGRMKKISIMEWFTLI